MGFWTTCWEDWYYWRPVCSIQEYSRVFHTILSGNNSNSSKSFPWPWEQMDVCLSLDPCRACAKLSSVLSSSISYGICQRAGVWMLSVQIIIILSTVYQGLLTSSTFLGLTAIYPRWRKITVVYISILASVYSNKEEKKWRNTNIKSGEKGWDLLEKHTEDRQYSQEYVGCKYFHLYILVPHAWLGV